MISVRRDDEIEGLIRLDQLIDDLDRVRRMHVVIHVAVHQEEVATQVLRQRLVGGALEIICLAQRVLVHEPLILLGPIDVVAPVVVVARP